MNIGINIGAYPCSHEEQVALMQTYGFSATFCSSLHPQLAETVALCRRAGITVESCHAPWNGINHIWRNCPEGEDMITRLLASVDECAAHGIPVLVVHLSSGEHPPRVSDLGLSRFEQLMAQAKERGVTIAYENQRMLGNLSLAFEEFPDAAFCWDNGHEACFTDGKRDYMALFGDRLTAIHIHDNRATHDADDHRIPGDGCIDFAPVIQKLAKANYQKALMLELVAGHTPAYAEINADAFFARAAAAARRLADAVDAAR